MPMKTDPQERRVVELFAGVGGFRIGLERSGLADRLGQPVGAQHQDAARVRLLRRSISAPEGPSARTSTR